MQCPNWLRGRRGGAALRTSRRRRSRFLPSLEPLESRRLLANLRVTGASLIDGNLNPVAQPVIGSMLGVKVDFTTDALPAGSKYTLAFTVQGVQLKWDNIDWGSGLSFGTWYSTKYGWYAESGTQHTVQVQLDLNNSVSETNEADNAFSFTVTPIRAMPPVKFTWPETGTLGVDRSLTNYLDLDPTSGIRDFTGGISSYDGHAGIDSGGANNADMDLGITILAAAPGTVIEAVDGNFDRNRGSLDNIVPGGDPNYVAIDHGGGLVSYHLHMRRDSIRVKVGDTVTRGQALGLEGSSGHSTGTHLHFEVAYNNVPVETYLDTATFWENAPPWIMTSRALLKGGITNYNLGNHLGEDVSNFTHYLPIGGQRVYAWGLYSGVRKDDQVRAVYRRPNGTVYDDVVLTAGRDWSSSYWYFVTTLPNNPDQGAWTVDMLSGGQLLKTFSFDVANNPQPEIRVEELDPTMIVLDERSTPYDFGTPAVGSTPPTQTFRVVNHGSGALAIQSLQVPAGFTIVDGLPTTLAAGQSDTFTIGMSTTSAGYKAGQVRILTNDPDEAETNFAIEGTVQSALPQLKLGVGLRRSPEGTQVIANVSRSGSTSAALTVALTSNDLTEATVPSSITIPAGDSRTTFIINTVQDNVFDLKQIVQLFATATGYTSAANTLDVEDAPGLAMSLTNSSISENGGATTVTLTRSFANLAQPLSVQLSASIANALSFPPTVTFDANEQSIAFDVAAIDNSILEGPRSVNLVATSSTHGNASASVTLLDEELLALEFDKISISENTGQTTVTIRRLNTNINSPLSVQLINRNPTQATLPESIDIPAGIASASVTLSATDDNLLDGSQTVLIEAQANGYVTASRSILVTDYETLTVSIGAPTMSEQGGRVTGTVRRNNTDISLPILVNLSSNDTTEATVPNSVTIPASQESVTFVITAADDFLLDGTQNVVITASSSGYVASTVALQVEDAETLSLAINTTSISERSGSTTATVTRSNTNTTFPLTVSLNSSDPGEANVPPQVTIPAGQSSVSFNITSVDDDLLDGSQTSTINATASGYQSASRDLTVTDYEELSLTIVDATLSERQSSTLARITRGNTDIGSDLVVTLSSTDPSEATVPTQVIISAGQQFKEFDVTAVDDDLLDGTQNLTINASAAGYAGSSVGLAVTDYETITLTIQAAAISEKGGVTTGTLTRHNTDLQVPLSFTLNNSDPTEADVPSSVTIDAGQASATFDIKGLDDSFLDGDQLVTIAASHPAYQSSSVQLTVSDWEELAVSVLPSSISEAGGQATVRVSRTNFDNTSPLEVTILNSDPSELTSVTTVTIPSGQSSVQFTVTGADDQLLDGVQTSQLTASAQGYASSTQTVTIEDAETLTITFDVPTISEISGSTTATITRSNTDIDSPMVVSLASTPGQRITLPTSITILAGQATQSFEIVAVDDVLLNSSTLVEVQVSSSGYADATGQLSIADDEALAPWRNPRRNLDVDNSGQVVPLDALLVINSINAEGSRKLPNSLPDPFDPPRYYDCNGDGFLSAFDALLVINFLNSSSSSEGEAAIGTPAAIDAAFSSFEDILRRPGQAQRRSGNVTKLTMGNV